MVLSSPVSVALVSSLVTALLVLLTSRDWPTSECHVLSEWWATRRGNLEQLANSSSLQRPGDDSSLGALTQLGQITYHTLKDLGWRSGVHFSRFETVGLQQVLDAPYHHMGALVLIVPGSAVPARRGSRPFLSIEESAGNLTAALPLGAINSVASAVEAARGRQLFGFRLQAAPLRTCRSGDGPCAVWEVSSGRVVLDAELAARVGRMPELRAPLGQFWGEVLGQVQAAAAKLGPGQETLAALSNLFASAGPRALGALTAAAGGATAAGSMPLWFCIACPAVLGLLSPFLFNFGLTAAAEQVCQHWQLPDDECADLWWGAFALAMVLSLASAIPIVYICRLPECTRHLVRA